MKRPDVAASLALLGLVAALMSADAGPSHAASAPVASEQVASEPAAPDRAIERSWPAARHGAVEIELAAGTLRVVGADIGRVRLDGTLGADALLDVDREGRWTRLRVVRAPTAAVGARLTLSSELALTVPTASDVTVRGQGVDLELRGVTGRVDIETVAGRVTVRGTPRALEVVSVSGALDLEVTTPELRAKTVAGALRIAGAIDDVRAETVTGELTLDAAVDQEARLVSVLGPVRVAGPLASTARLVARTGSAPLEIHLAAAATPEGAATIEVTSQRGSFHDPAGPTFDDAGDGDGPHEVHYRLGEAPRRLELESFDGAIRIVRPAAPGRDPDQPASETTSPATEAATLAHGAPAP